MITVRVLSFVLTCSVFFRLHFFIIDDFFCIRIFFKLKLIGVEHLCYQANPDPNTCLGVFGLSLYTTERDLREVFSRYGPLTGVNVVYDQRTGRSRGFAFVYFERIDDSKEVNTCFTIFFGCALYALSSLIV